MFRLYNVTGGEIVSQLNSSSGGVRVSSSHLEQAARRTGPVRTGDDAARRRRRRRQRRNVAVALAQDDFDRRRRLNRIRPRPVQPTIHPVIIDFHSAMHVRPFVCTFVSSLQHVYTYVCSM